MWNVRMLYIYYLGCTYLNMCNIHHVRTGNRIPICHLQLLCTLLDWKTNMSNYINPTGFSSGAGNCSSFRNTPEFTTGLYWGWVTLSLFWCVCFVDRCLYFFIWPLWWPFFFGIRILITPVLSVSSSYIDYIKLSVVFEMGYSDANVCISFCFSEYIFTVYFKESVNI